MKPRALTQAARSAASLRQQAARGQRHQHGRRPSGVARAGRGGDDTRPRRRPRRVSGPLRATERLSLSLSAARAAAVALPLRPPGGRDSAPRTERQRPARSSRDRAARTPRERASRSPREGAARTPGERAPRAAQREPRIGRERRHAAEAAAKPSLGLRVRAVVVSLPDHPWLDRVVRGRVWIPLLGVLLAGIVAAQVEILKLNASMGRSLEQNGTLTTQNQLLQQNVASLSDDQRIERLATGMGLVAPPPGAVGFLAAKPGGQAGGAVANLHAPNPSSFVMMTPSNGAIVTGPGASTLPSTSGPTVPTPTATPPANAASASTGVAAGGSTSASGSTGVAAGGSTAASGSTGVVAGGSTSASGSTGAAIAGAGQQASGG